MSDISAKVKAIIVDKLGVDAAEVTPEASFTNDRLILLSLSWNLKKSLASPFLTTKPKISVLLAKLSLILRKTLSSNQKTFPVCN